MVGVLLVDFLSAVGDHLYLDLHKLLDFFQFFLQLSVLVFKRLDFLGLF